MLKKETIIKSVLITGLIFLIGLPGIVKAEYITNSTPFTYNGQTHNNFVITGGHKAYCIDFGVDAGIINQTVYTECNVLANSQLLAIRGYLEQYSGETENIKAIRIGNYVKGYGFWHDTAGSVTVTPAASITTSAGGCSTEITATIALNKETGTFTLNDDKTYYVSEAIAITSSFSKYTISLTGAPSSTIIVTDPNATTSINLNNQTANTIYVKIPKDSVTNTINMSLKVEGTYSCSTTNTTIKAYCPASGNYQRIVSLLTSSSSNSNNKNDIITLSLSPINSGKLTITKTNDAEAPLEGVKFNLYDTDDDEKCTNILSKNADDENIGVITTDNNGKATVNNLLFGKYCLIESETLNTVKKLVAPTLVTIDDSENEIEIINYEIKLTISKKAITGEDELPGATIRIIDKDTKTIVKEFKSTEEPTTFTISKGNYILSEIVAPIGYDVIKNEIEFTIGDDGTIKINSKENEIFTLDDENEIYTLTIKNSPKKLYVLKTDISNITPLEGATMKITCDNNYEYEFVSTDEAIGIDINNMLGAACTLKEIEAPEEYEKIDASLKFEVSQNGVVTIRKVHDNHYELDNDTIIVYNGITTDTALSAWAIVTIIGVGSIGFGTYLLLYTKAKRKNS